MSRELSTQFIEATLTRLSNKWKILIIKELLTGTKRFSDIKKALGSISGKVLTVKLREMEKQGLLSRHVYAEVPPKVEYTLTESGKSLETVLLAIHDWGFLHGSLAAGDISFCDKKGSLVIIKRAEKEDVEEILALQYLAYQSEAELLKNPDIPPLTQTLDDASAEYDKGIFLKAVDSFGKIIGSARWFEEDGTVYIGKLMVLPEMQGRGIGSALLDAVEKMQPAKRYELFTSNKSEQNIELYEKHGYERFKEKSINYVLKLVYLEKLVTR